MFARFLHQVSHAFPFSVAGLAVLLLIFLLTGQVLLDAYTAPQVTRLSRLLRRAIAPLVFILLLAALMRLILILS